MTMHRLFDNRVRPYILIDVKTNSEESSCAKKLFLYGFLLSMLSNMNYVCIHSDSNVATADVEIAVFTDVVNVRLSQFITKM